MKRLICTVLLLLLLPVGSAGAEELLVWVADDAGLMTHLQALDLDERLQELHNGYDLNVSIHTTNTLGGKSPGQYADDYYDAHFGAGTDGILFLLSMEDRDWYISTSGRGRELLSDNEYEDSAQEILHYLSDGEYYAGFRQWTVDLPGYLDYTQPPPQPNFWVALGIGLVVALIAILIMRSTMNTKRQQASARHYLVKDSYRLGLCQDFYLYSDVTKTPRPKDNHSGGGGRSHGGGGGKF